MNQLRYIILTFFVGIASIIASQNVSQVLAHQEGQTAVITYYLDQLADITVQVSIDGGQTFSPPLVKVSGDVGQDIRPGFRRIVWDILAEREQFTGDNIVFMVSAYGKKPVVAAPPVPQYNTTPQYSTPQQQMATPTYSSSAPPQQTYQQPQQTYQPPQPTYTPTPQQSYPPASSQPMIQSANAHGGHEYVNLGLPSGTLWATCNLGANRPEEYGHYYAWGACSLSSNYTWPTYKHCQGTYESLTKYCTLGTFGMVDSRKVLEYSDDAARQNWGGNWRLPNKQEQDELREKCKWAWVSLNGVNGYQVTGPNGKSIFLPAAGLYDGMSVSLAGTHGYYWSSSLLETLPRYAFFLLFDQKRIGWFNSNRCLGHSVRPVCNL